MSRYIRMRKPNGSIVTVCTPSEAARAKAIARAEARGWTVDIPQTGDESAHKSAHSTQKPAPDEPKPE